MSTISAVSTTDTEPTNDSTGGADAHVSRRHHYVPCFLLAGFTPSGRQSDHLWVFDRERTKPKARTPKAVAFERDFYWDGIQKHGLLPTSLSVCLLHSDYGGNVGSWRPSF